MMNVNKVIDISRSKNAYFFICLHYKFRYLQ